MESIQTISSGLANFYGTEHYHRWSVLFPHVLTDGANFLAEKAQCFWWMDMIVSHMPQGKETFCVAKLERKQGNSFTFTLTDGNYKVLATQEIEYSDFPLDSYELFVQYSNDRWFIMLKSEY